jgi:WD40 repeat protein
VAEVSVRELLAAVDEELRRLPEAYRGPVLLCCLEGLTQEEAARRLDCPAGALRGRVTRGRALLRERLAARGLSLSAALAAALLSGPAASAALPRRLVEAACATAAGLVARRGAPLAAGVVRLRLTGVALLAGALGVAAAATFWHTPAAAEPPPAPPAAPAPAKEAARLDRFGDPLPDGALARLGTVRFRHSWMTYSLAFSPDGKVIAATGGNSNVRSLTLWDAATGRLLHAPPLREAVYGVAFSPNGKTLAAVGPRLVALYDVATGGEIRRSLPTGSFTCVSFAPDGRTFTAGSHDDDVHRWDAATGAELPPLKGHTASVLAVAHSPDGRLLASAGNDGTVRLWDPATGNELRRCPGHPGGAFEVTFAPDGRTLASKGDDNVIRVSDAATGKELRAIRCNPAGIRCLAFAPDGKALASGERRFVRLYDPATGRELRSWPAHTASVHGLAFAPDGKTVATGSVFDSTVHLWDAATGRERNPPDVHHGPIEWLTFIDGGRGLLSHARDHRLLRWDLRSWTARPVFEPPADNPSVVFPSAVSPDGRTVARVTTADRTVRLWDAATGREVAKLATHKNRVVSLAFTADGHRLASGSVDGVVSVWDLGGAGGGKADGHPRELHQLEPGAPNGVWGLTFAPDGRTLAGGLNVAFGQPSPVVLWDAGTGKELRRLASGPQPDRLCFSPDGRLLAGASGSDYRDTDIRVWEVTTGREVRRLRGHAEGVYSLAFSPDGRLLASGGRERDDTLRLWDVASGQELLRRTGHHSGVWCIAFSEDGRRLATGGGDSTVLLWDLAGRAAGLPVGPPSPARLDGYWRDLAGADADAAYRAVRALAGAPREAVPYLAARLRPVASVDSATVARLAADLDAEDFAVREKAAASLAELGDAAAPTLRHFLSGSPSPEARRRAGRLLEEVIAGAPVRRAARAVQALEYAGTPEARQLLGELAKGDPDARLTAESRAALARPAP